MALDTPSRDYIAQRDTWKQIRALSAGASAAREYVATLPGMGDDRFDLFKKRAYYLPALPRTVETFGGLIFLREPQKKAPAALDPYIRDATLTGLSIDSLSSWAVNEVIETGRIAVLVDCPKAPAGLSVAQAEALGVRAYARVYETETILSAEYGNFGGVRKLFRVRLQETKLATDGEFNETATPRIRMLELDGGVYTQRVFEKQAAGQWLLVEESQPVRGGKTLDYIPIFFMNHRDHDAGAMRPPLADLSDVSISHLNSSALREWGEMWTANPTPWFAGVMAAPTNEQGETSSTYSVKLGSSEAILLSKDGKAGFLEFAGAGLASIGETLDRKEKHMAALGTRALLEDPRQAIAAETARIQNAGQNSTLGRIAAVGSAMMTNVLRELAKWANVSDLESINYALNKNFVPAGMPPEKIKANIAAVQAGLMSSQEFLKSMQASDEIDPAKEWEEHLFEIEEDDARIASRSGGNEDPAAV